MWQYTISHMLVVIFVRPRIVTDHSLQFSHIGSGRFHCFLVRALPFYCPNSSRICKEVSKRDVSQGGCG